MKRIAVLLLFVAGFLSACSTTRWAKNPVADQKDFKVSLEFQSKDGQALPQHNDHPCTMNQREVAAFLKGLDYQEGGHLFGEAKKGPIFQDEELARLAPAITEALAKADANQRITFYSFNRVGEFIFSHQRVTEGILFIKPKNELNIAFSLIDYDLNTDRNYQIPPGSDGRDPLTIRVSDIKAMPTAPYTKRHVFADGNESPMWIVANLNDLKAAVKAEEQSAAGTSATKQEGRTLPSAGKTIAAPAEKPPVGTVEMRQEQIQKKLEFLKGLYDKGLIDQKEYDKKKAEILNEIK